MTELNKSEGQVGFMLKKGGVETIITIIILVALVLGLIMTAVKQVSDGGEAAIQNSVDNLAGNQVTMH